MITQPNVLYVEDDSKSRLVMKMVLVNRLQLPHVTIFEDSADFIARAEALDPKPDIVFLDIHVDPYSGFEMLEMLRQSEHFTETCVVALTASVMNEEIDKLKNAGFDGCLSKPIDIDTIPELLDQIMNGEKIWNIMV